MYEIRAADGRRQHVFLRFQAGNSSRWEVDHLSVAALSFEHADDVFVVPKDYECLVSNLQAPSGAYDGPRFALARLCVESPDNSSSHVLMYMESDEATAGQFMASSAWYGSGGDGSIGDQLFLVNFQDEEGYAVAVWQSSWFADEDRNGIPTSYIAIREFATQPSIGNWSCSRQFRNHRGGDSSSTQLRLMEATQVLDVAGEVMSGTYSFVYIVKTALFAEIVVLATRGGPDLSASSHGSCDDVFFRTCGIPVPGAEMAAGGIITLDVATLTEHYAVAVYSSFSPTDDGPTLKWFVCDRNTYTPRYHSTIYNSTDFSPLFYQFNSLTVDYYQSDRTTMVPMVTFSFTTGPAVNSTTHVVSAVLASTRNRTQWVGFPRSTVPSSPGGSAPSAPSTGAMLTSSEIIAVVSGSVAVVFSVLVVVAVLKRRRKNLAAPQYEPIINSSN